MIGRINFGDDNVGGECVFVPSSPGELDDEDDGYLVSFVTRRDGKGASGKILQHFKGGAGEGRSVGSIFEGT